MGGWGIRTARNLSAAAVATITAWSSYYHILHVALRVGERPEVAYALPVSVDGMLVVATIVMADDKRHHRPPRPLARLAFCAGVLASVAANIAAAAPTLAARVVDAWPAIALLLVVEMLAHPSAADGKAEDGPADRAAATQVPPQDAGSSVDAPTYSPATRRATPAGEAPLPHGDADAPAVAGGRMPALGSPHRRSSGPTAAPVKGAATYGHAVPADVAGGTLSSSGAHTPVAVHTSGGPPLPNAAGGREVPPARPSDAGVGGDPVAEDQTMTIVRSDRPVAELDGGGAMTMAVRRADGTRRPTALTRRLAETIMEAEPQLSRTELAGRLGVSTRRLREVLAT